VWAPAKARLHACMHAAACTRVMSSSRGLCLHRHCHATATAQQAHTRSQARSAAEDEELGDMLGLTEPPGSTASEKEKREGTLNKWQDPWEALEQDKKEHSDVMQSSIAKLAKKQQVDANTSNASSKALVDAMGVALGGIQAMDAPIGELLSPEVSKHGVAACIV
jgi:hypothetical protein